MSHESVILLMLAELRSERDQARAENLTLRDENRRLQELLVDSAAHGRATATVA